MKVGNKREKKILALVLIFLLAMSSFGCGKDDEEGQDGSGDGTVTLEPADGDEIPDDGEGISDEESDQTITGQAEYDEKVNEDASDIKVDDYGADEFEAAFDFGFSVGASFGLSDVIKKMEYGDLSAKLPDLEKVVQETASRVFGGSFDGFSDFEEDDEDDIDKLAYAVAMENSDTEGRYLEGGVYHHVTGNHFQYIAFSTSNFYEINDSNIKTIMDDAKKAMGVTLSKSRLKKAIEIAFGNAKEKEDYYSLYEIDNINGKGYTETVRVSVDGFATEENQIGYYVYIERERCYE